MSTSLHARFVLFVGSLGLIVLANGCGSTQSSATTDRPEKTGHPARVRFFDYSSGQKLELVNESHSDRTQLYSSTKKLEDAVVKVTPDEVLDETIANFEKSGFFEKAAPGSAPATGSAGVSRALEVERDGKSHFWAIAKTAPEADRKRFTECTTLFTFVYNNTYQLQSVERAPDWQSQNNAMKKPRKQ